MPRTGTWRERRLRRAGALGAALALAAVPALAVNKCVQPDGTVVYQDAPCANSAQRAQRLHIHPSPPPPAPRPAASAASAAAAPPAAAPGPQPAPQPVQAPPEKSELELRADACLDWYRPMLRDPRSAYWRDAFYVQGTLNITVVATNGFGGYVNTPAACDFKQGAIDQGWTRTQARRRNWAVP